MIRTGNVVSINRNKPMVSFSRLAACEKCGQCAGEKKHALVPVLGEARVGDIVDVELPDKKILASSLVMFFLPLLGLVGGVMAGRALSFGDPALVLSAFAGMLLAGAVMKGVDNRIKNDPQWQPTIVKVYKAGEIPSFESCPNHQPATERKE